MIGLRHAKKLGPNWFIGLRLYWVISAHSASAHDSPLQTNGIKASLGTGAFSWERIRLRIQFIFNLPRQYPPLSRSTLVTLVTSKPKMKKRNHCSSNLFSIPRPSAHRKARRSILTSFSQPSALVPQECAQALPPNVQVPKIGGFRCQKPHLVSKAAQRLRV